MRIKLRAGETRDEFLYRCWCNKCGMTWKELAVIASDALDEDLNGEQMRKRVERYREHHDLIETNDDIFRSLQMQKQVFRDERNAWNKQNREQARTEENLHILSDELKTIGAGLFADTSPRFGVTEQKTMLILLTDWHIGGQWENAFGEYSPEIARERIKTLLRETNKLQKNYCCEKCVIICAGDMINGAIRRTVQLQNRENVITQIRDATELLTNFVHCVCTLFQEVELTGCAGNHSRLIENKESAVKDDRLDSLITWATSKMLAHIENFTYREAMDTTLTVTEIYGREVVGVHGDYDAFSKNGIQNIAAMLGRFPWMVCFGHMHSPAYSEEGNSILLRGGSLCGAGDDYTIQKRLIGRPSQTIAIITPNGLHSVHPVTL